MNKAIKILNGFLVLLIIAMFIWGINIIPKQMAYQEECKSACLDENLSYQISFDSNPWDNVNGKCFCLEEINLEEVEVCIKGRIMIPYGNSTNDTFHIECMDDK